MLYSERPLLDLPELPDTVFKYRPTSGLDGRPNEFTLDLIRLGQIYFASAREFNDPFDSALGYSFDDSDHAKRKWVMGMLRRTRPELSRQDRRAEAQRQLLAAKMNPDATMGVVQKRMQEARYRIGIFCSAGSRDDLLMWAHYARNHTGVCIGLRKAVLQREAARQLENHRRLMHSLSVKYVDVFKKWPFFDPIRDENALPFLRSTIGTKSKHWEYEQEYRLAMFDYAGSVINCGPELVSDIVFGCRATDSDEQRVRKAAEAEGVRATFWRAKQHSDRFELVIEREP